jgi:hypothetical protein
MQERIFYAPLFGTCATRSSENSVADEIRSYIALVTVERISCAIFLCRGIFVQERLSGAILFPVRIAHLRLLRVQQVPAGVPEEGGSLWASSESDPVDFRGFVIHPGVQSSFQLAPAAGQSDAMACRVSGLSQSTAPVACRRSCPAGSTTWVSGNPRVRRACRASP